MSKLSGAEEARMSRWLVPPIWCTRKTKTTPKRIKVNMTLNDAIKRLYDELPKTLVYSPIVCFWTEDNTSLIEVTNKFQALMTLAGNLWVFNEDPFVISGIRCEQIDMIVKVSSNKLEVQKNRYGKSFTLNYEPEELTMSDNSDHWTYKHLHPDSAGYADCFRILREAIENDIIRDWCYGADMPDGGPGIDVYPMKSHGYESFRDPEGTKGDINIFREAADYVLKLRNEYKEPKTSVYDMTT